MAENIDQDTIRCRDFIEEEPAYDLEEEPAYDLEEEPAYDLEEEPAYDSEEEPGEVVYSDVSENEFTSRESFKDIITLKIESYMFTEERNREILQGVLRVLMAADSRIRTLNFFCTKISDEDVELLIGALENNSTLTRLTFSFCSITAYGENLLVNNSLARIFGAELLIEGESYSYERIIEPSSNITVGEFEDLYLWSATTNPELDRS